MEIEDNCNALGSLFQAVVGSMKEGWPAFEELAARTTKLHSSLRATMIAVNGFLDSFQKIADIATSAHGATKDTGKALTRLCLRHRAIEAKLKGFTGSLLEGMAFPLQEKVEEWKKNAVYLDKEHGRDAKKARQDIKKASSDTIRLQKKAKKGKGDAKERLEQAMSGVSSRFSLLEDVEKKYVRKALLEERRHFCEYIICIKPMVDAEISMIGEVTHLQEIMDMLSSLAADPDNLPESSEQVIRDVKGANLRVPPFQTPPDSPLRSRASSMASVGSLVSVPESTSSDQSATQAVLTQKPDAPEPPLRLVSITSRDSGFTSQDTLYAKPPTPPAAPSFCADSFVQQRIPPSGPRPVSELATIRNSVSGQHASARGGNFDSTSLQGADSGYLSQQSYDRPHTISSATSNHRARPGIGRDTFDPPSAGQYHAPSAVMSSQGSLGDFQSVGGGSQIDPRQLMPPPVGIPLRSQVGRREGRGSVGAVPIRGPKLKPVRTPSIPFMESEPVYMNTAELAQRIAEHRRDDDRRSLRSTSSHDSIASSNPPMYPSNPQLTSTIDAHHSNHSSASSSTHRLHSLTNVHPSMGSLGRRPSLPSPMEELDGIVFDVSHVSPIDTPEIGSGHGTLLPPPNDYPSYPGSDGLSLPVDLSEIPPPPPPDSFLADVTEEGPMDSEDVFTLPPPPPASYANGPASLPPVSYVNGPTSVAGAGFKSAHPITAFAESLAPPPRQTTLDSYSDDVAAQDLADVIKELESATASLTLATEAVSAGENRTHNHEDNHERSSSARNSLNGSSGYGTTNSLSSNSDESHMTILAGPTMTIPAQDNEVKRSSPDTTSAMAGHTDDKSIAVSTATTGAEDINVRKRTSKPPPPVRRTSSSVQPTTEDHPSAASSSIPPSTSTSSLPSRIPSSFAASPPGGAKPPPIAVKPDKLLTRSRSSAGSVGEAYQKKIAVSSKPCVPTTTTAKTTAQAPRSIQQSQMSAARKRPENTGPVARAASSASSTDPRRAAFSQGHSKLQQSPKPIQQISRAHGVSRVSSSATASSNLPKTGTAPWDRSGGITSKLPVTSQPSVSQQHPGQSAPSVGGGGGQGKANFMAQLNAKLGGGGSTLQADSDMRRTGNGEEMRKVAVQVQKTPSGSRDSLLSEIQNGRSLKKAYTNDRSSPKVT